MSRHRSATSCAKRPGEHPHRRRPAGQARRLSRDPRGARPEPRHGDLRRGGAAAGAEARFRGHPARRQHAGPGRPRDGGADPQPQAARRTFRSSSSPPTTATRCASARAIRSAPSTTWSRRSFPRSCARRSRCSSTCTCSREQAKRQRRGAAGAGRGARGARRGRARERSASRSWRRRAPRCRGSLEFDRDGARACCGSRFRSWPTSPRSPFPARKASNARTELAWSGRAGRRSRCASNRSPAVDCGWWRDAIARVLASGVSESFPGCVRRAAATRGRPPPPRQLEIPRGSPLDSLAILPLIARGRTIGVLSLGLGFVAADVSMPICWRSPPISPTAPRSRSTMRCCTGRSTTRTGARTSSSRCSRTSSAIRSRRSPTPCTSCRPTAPTPSKLDWAREVIGRQVKQLAPPGRRPARRVADHARQDRAQDRSGRRRRSRRRRRRDRAAR